MGQIYILDKDTNKCAQYYCNKDILLKILEFSDMLCVAHQQVNKGVENNIDVRINWRNYFAQNEACFVWARETLQNYRWLSDLAIALCSEYTYRYEKKHNYEDKIKWLKENEPLLIDEGLTQFIIPSSDKYKTDDPIESWRKYYIDEKQKMAQWGKRGNPYWFAVLTQNATHENNQENKKILQIKKGTKTKAKEKFKDSQKYLAWAKSYVSKFDRQTNRLQSQNSEPLVLNTNVQATALSSVSLSCYSAVYAVQSLMLLLDKSYVSNSYGFPGSIEHIIVELEKWDADVYQTLMRHIQSAKFLDKLSYLIRRCLKNADYSGGLVLLKDNPDPSFLDACRSALFSFESSNLLIESEDFDASQYLNKQTEFDILTYAECVKLSINKAEDIISSVDSFAY